MLVVFPLFKGSNENLQKFVELNMKTSSNINMLLVCNRPQTRAGLSLMFWSLLFP